MVKVKAFLFVVLLCCAAALSAQLPTPVTPSTTPGPSAPFAGRSVATFTALPPSGNALGDCRSTRDTGLLYCWNGSWVTGSGGGGSGTLTSFGVSSLPWLAVANPTTTPVLSPATGQTSGLVIGTCGSATTVGLCALTAAMIPTLNQNTTGNAATSSDGLSSASGTAPLNLSLSSKALTGSVTITPANPGGAVALQATTPGTAQTGNANLSGTMIAGAFSGPLTGNVTGNASGTATNVTGTVAAAHGGTDNTAAADSSILIGNGTVFLLKLVADCIDSGGNHLNYTAATHTFSCGTSSSGGGALSNPLPAGSLSSAALQVVDAGTGLSQQAAHTLSLAANGAGFLRGIGVASPTDYLTATASATGGGATGPQLGVGGSDATIDLLFNTKGASSRIVWSINGVSLMDFTDVGGGAFALRNLSGQFRAGGGILDPNFVAWNNDTYLFRAAAGVAAVSSAANGNGGGSLLLTEIQLVPGAVGTCGSGQKGHLRVAADGTLCSCNGTTWTATPLTGSCI